MEYDLTTPFGIVLPKGVVLYFSKWRIRKEFGGWDAADGAVVSFDGFPQIFGYNIASGEPGFLHGGRECADFAGARFEGAHLLAYLHEDFIAVGHDGDEIYLEVIPGSVVVNIGGDAAETTEDHIFEHLSPVFKDAGAERRRHGMIHTVYFTEFASLAGD